MLLLRVVLVVIGGSFLPGANDEEDILVQMCHSAMRQSMSSLAHGTMEFDESLQWTHNHQIQISGTAEWDNDYYRCSVTYRQSRIGDDGVASITMEKAELLKSAGGLLLRSQRKKGEAQEEGSWRKPSLSIWPDETKAKYNSFFVKDVRVLWFSDSCLEFLPIARDLEESTLIKESGKSFRRTSHQEGDIIRVILEFDGGWKKDIEFSLAAGGNIVEMTETEPPQSPNDEWRFGRRTYDWGTDSSGRWYPKSYELKTRKATETGEVIFHHLFMVKSLSPRSNRETPTSLTVQSLGEIPDGTQIYKYNGAKMPTRSVQGGESGLEETLRQEGRLLKKEGFTRQRGK
jgi:hypothetical protein